MSIQSILVLCSMLFVALFAAGRANAYGINPARRAHQLLPGVLIAVPITLYALSISHTPGASLESSPSSLIARAALVGVLLAVLGAARFLGLRLLFWADICVPAALLGVATVSLGAAFTEGPSVELIFAAFWQLGTLWALLRVERLLGGWLRPGDLLLLAGVLSAPGALLGILLRAHRLCQEPQLNACQGTLSTAPLLVIAAGIICATILGLRHLWRANEAAISEQARPPA